MEFVILIFLALAVSRVTRLLVFEDGMYFMFLRLRHFVGLDNLTSQGKEVISIEEKIHFSKKNIQLFDLPRSELARMLTCTWCTSVWVSLFFVFLYHFFGDEQLFFYFVLVLGISEAHILLDK